MFTKLRKNRKGISRILEAVIASVILLMTYSAAAVMIRSADVQVIQESGDLDRLGYNVLSTIIESGAIHNPTTLKLALQANLPPTIYFNFTILNCINDPNGAIYIQPDNNYGKITNTNDDTAFVETRQVSSTSTIFTAPNGQIKQLILQLTRAGG
jgi:hypothetical protein